MQAAEIEVKIPLADPQAFEARLPALGFQLETARRFERNTLYDTPDRALRSTHQILRIREYGDVWTLTHKRHPDHEDPEVTRYKVRVETETTVADGYALAEIFTRLGYIPMFRYEKYRTEWSQNGAHLVIDETPIGTFAELEGPIAWIDSTLKSLAIDPNSCLSDSYGRLFTVWKERTESPAENLTFDEIAAPVPSPS